MFMRKSESFCSDCPRPALFEENVEAWELFLSCLTQFNFSNGRPIGLNYQSVDFVIGCKGIERNDELFRRLQLLESEYIKLINYV